MFLRTVLILIILCVSHTIQANDIGNKSVSPNIIDLDPAENWVPYFDTKDTACFYTGIKAGIGGNENLGNYQYYVDTSAPQCFVIGSESGELEYCTSFCDKASGTNSEALKIVALSSSNDLITGTFNISYEPEANTIKEIKKQRVSKRIPTSLLSFNQGNDKSLEGWKWHDDVAYGNPGWILNETEKLGKGNKYRWGLGPRIFNKHDYGKENKAFITQYERAPSTSTGGALVVQETENSIDHRSTWWLWYDGIPLHKRGITNQQTDRMSFYIKLDGTDAIKDDGKDQSIKNNVHIGTYLCWEGKRKSWSTGEGCPYEGPGNQHYYHYLAINPGAWIHVLLDQHPQHKRNTKTTIPNNPVAKDGKSYFAQLNKFYLEVRYPQQQRTHYIVDEIEFYSTKDTYEPNQNEDSITSLWVGYWKDKDYWEIGFHDESFEKLHRGTFSTFEVKWSTQPITNENYSLANAIEPELYSGIQYTGNDFNGYVRRANDWAANVWTRFKINQTQLKGISKLYFAVKDVSSKGQNQGTKWPWTRGDGHDAPTSNIKTIEYYLRAD